MLTVLIVHALVFYSHHVFIDYIIHFKTPYILVDYILIFLHYFNMPIFFLLAGYFAKYIITSHSFAYYVNERLVKLALPLLIGMLCLIPFHALIFASQIMRNVSLSQTYQQLFTTLFSVFLNPEYFWFLYYLLIYSLLSMLMYKIPICKIIPKCLFSKRFYIPASIALLTLLLLTGRSPLIALPLSIKPIAQPFLVYGFFFYYGWISYSKSFIFENNKQHCWLILMLGICSVIGFIMLLKYHPHNDLGILKAIINAITLFAITNGLFGLFNRYFNKNIKLFRHWSTISYWTYLINFPLLTLFSLLFFELPIPLFFKIVLELCCVLLISSISYQFIIKRTFLLQIYQGRYQLKLMRRWLNSKKEYHDETQVLERI